MLSTPLQGIWAAIPTVWNNRDQVDTALLRENVRRICRAGAHGVYTHGTTGEFYAQTTQEWRHVVETTINVCREYSIPCQVGCTALWTGEAVERVRYAHALGAYGIQIAFPFWLPLTDNQIIRFLTDITMAAPNMPIIIYNTERAKRLLSAALLEQLVSHDIPIVGVKGVQNKIELQELLSVDGNLSIFVNEHLLAEYIQAGASGSYSAFVNINPYYMLHYYELCKSRDPEAHRIASLLTSFMDECLLPRYEKGLYDTALDRCLAAMTGFLAGPLLRSRAPYDSAAEGDVRACREWCSRNLPELVHLPGRAVLKQV